MAKIYNPDMASERLRARTRRGSPKFGKSATWLRSRSEKPFTRHTGVWPSRGGKCSQEPLPTVISRSGPVTAGGAGRLIPGCLACLVRLDTAGLEGDRRPLAGVEAPRPAQVLVPPRVAGVDAPGIELGTGAYRPASAATVTVALVSG